jgi:murein DD-endopeptidase MepM/ murein hydrolase activator NlpD
MKTKIAISKLVSTAMLLMLLITLLVPAVTAKAAAATVTGYLLPWPSGITYTVTGVRTAHAAVNGVPRQSIDFGTYMSTPILVMKAGTVVFAQDIVSGGGGMIIVDTNDGFCSVYLHLSAVSVSSGDVVRGQRIGLSGKSSNGAVHTHIAVFSRSGSNCGGYSNDDKTREAVVIFDEVGRELNYNDQVTSATWHQHIR